MLLPVLFQFLSNSVIILSSKFICGSESLFLLFYYYYYSDYYFLCVCFNICFHVKFGHPNLKVKENCGLCYNILLQLQL